MRPIKRIGLDLAKTTFSLCGVDHHGSIVLEKKLKRKDLLIFFSNLTPCMVAMETGSGAHYWARELIRLGHDARIIDAHFVVPYRDGGGMAKNDRNDARAICEAAGRPKMRFVPVKTADQQAVLLVHRRRTSIVAERTRTGNQLRGFLAEFGVVIPRGTGTLLRDWHRYRQGYHDRVPELAWEELDALFSHLRALDEQVREYDRKIKGLVRDDERTRRLVQISGVGPVTASAIVATVGDAQVFKNGRQFAAWLGLTPRQYSTGGKVRLGRITRRGDVYLRTLLVHGARSELRHTPRRSDGKSQWVERLKTSKTWNKTAVALANKHARMVWAILAKGEEYQPA